MMKSNLYLQCFDAVGWAAGRASGLSNINNSTTGIRPIKNWVVRCWHGYLSGARCRLAYGPADATASCFSKIQIGFAFSVPAHPDSPGQRAFKRVYVCCKFTTESDSEYCVLFFIDSRCRTLNWMCVLAPLKLWQGTIQIRLLLLR